MTVQFMILETQSVTGAVQSVAGAVQSVTGAVKSVTGAVKSESSYFSFLSFARNWSAYICHFLLLHQLHSLLQFLQAFSRVISLSDRINLPKLYLENSCGKCPAVGRCSKHNG